MTVIPIFSHYPSCGHARIILLKLRYLFSSHFIGWPVLIMGLKKDDFLLLDSLLFVTTSVQMAFLFNRGFCPFLFYVNFS